MALKTKIAVSFGEEEQPLKNSEVAVIFQVLTWQVSAGMYSFDNKSLSCMIWTVFCMRVKKSFSVKHTNYCFC